MADSPDPAALPDPPALPDPLVRDLERAVEALRRGGLVAFPTETVYGLGADAANPAAVERVFEVKGRPAGHPLIVHLGSAEQLDAWVLDVPPHARVLADAFWPGPLTLLLRRSSLVPDAVTGGRDTVGLRVPDHRVALALLERFGGGLAAPSANRFGRVSPTTADHVRADLGADVDVVLDGGPCRVGVESTIVDLSGDEPEVLRPGGVSFERLEEVLGQPVGLWLGDRDVAAPGTLATHYSPRAQVELVDATSVAERATDHLAAGRTVGVLASAGQPALPDGVVELEPVGDPDDYARLLYARLRQVDRLGLDVLLAIPPDASGVGVAIRDRLARAAAENG
jgi:L-threonylcarbamoyladenylate synthase